MLEQFDGQDYKSYNSMEIQFLVQYSISVTPLVHSTWYWQEASVYWPAEDAGVSSLTANHNSADIKTNEPSN